MNSHNLLTLLFVCGNVVGVRDFYAGWFNKDDILVAQDSVFRERRFYGRVYAHYARRFKCPISYYRVLDRLGTGTGPITKVLRGGLRKHFISLRITSAYSFPISVNIYIGCQNRLGTGPMFTRPPWTKKNTEAQTTVAGSSTQAGVPDADAAGPETNATGPETNGAGPETNGTGPETNGAGPATNGAKPETNGTGPVTDGAGPETNGTGPETNGTGPETNGAGPETNGTGPVTDGAGPETNGTGPETNSTGPETNSTGPETNGTES